YKSLFSLPSAPQIISQVMPRETLATVEDTLELEMTTLLGPTWQLRYELWMWAGIQITDEQFRDRMLEVDKAFGQPNHRWYQDLYLTRTGSERNLDTNQTKARIQIGVLLQLAGEAQGKPKPENITKLVDM